MNNFANSKVIKLSFFVLLAVLMLAGCKEKEVWPKETYEMLNKRSIKLVTYNNSSLSQFSFEESANKHVAVYTNQFMDLSQCNDCGYPFVAFEVDPSLSEFSYSSAQELENIRAISGQTSSIFGPYASPIRSGSISGRKTTDYSWIITIDLPADSTKPSESRKIKGVFTLK
ncbi:hypothetical protein [Runella aurantiaca]|uniref:Uncharacterized protein n=1 Tax=Runella aurantiaca TaxID=2282308 RepID=A0A369IDE3_9BACT|nr:hypothetical protein [Runella aurantiaca]RDB05513.1 hypothetical protein DVG78_13090 [Runella aurantiaca]